MKQEIIDLGVKDPDLLVTAKNEDDHYAFPTSKVFLAHHSTVFADMLAVSTQPTHRDSEGIKGNGWPEPYSKLDEVALEDDPLDLANTFRLLFPDYRRERELEDLETIRVYKTADKYCMSRLSEWMADKIALELSTYDKSLLPLACEASSTSDNIRLQKYIAKTLANRPSDWNLELREDVFHLGVSYPPNDSRKAISASCAAFIMSVCFSGTRYGFFLYT